MHAWEKKRRNAYFAEISFNCRKKCMMNLEFIEKSKLFGKVKNILKFEWV